MKSGLLESTRANCPKTLDSFEVTHGSLRSDQHSNPSSRTKSQIRRICIHTQGGSEPPQQLINNRVMGEFYRCKRASDDYRTNNRNLETRTSSSVRQVSLLEIHRVRAAAAVAEVCRCSWFQHKALWGGTVVVGRARPATPKRLRVK